MGSIDGGGALSMRYKTFLKTPLWFLLLVGLLAGGYPPTTPNQVAKVVTDCSKYGPGPGTLQAALVGSGTVTFACSRTIVVPKIILDADITIDATGQSITLSGNNTNAVLRIMDTRKVDLINLTITQGVNGGARNFGGPVILTNWWHF
jgi:hypothetical protein